MAKVSTNTPGDTDTNLSEDLIIYVETNTEDNRRTINVWSETTLKTTGGQTMHGPNHTEDNVRTNNAWSETTLKTIEGKSMHGLNVYGTNNRSTQTQKHDFLYRGGFSCPTFKLWGKTVGRM